MARNRVAMNCSGCGRKLVAIAGTKFRACSVCGTKTKVPENPVDESTPPPDPVSFKREKQRVVKVRTKCSHKGID